MMVDLSMSELVKLEKEQEIEEKQLEKEAKRWEFRLKRRR